MNTSGLLPIGTILRGTYRIDSYISSGGFGNTYKATNIAFKECVAIKEFFMRGVSVRQDDNTTVSVSNTDNKDTFAAQLEKFKKEARRIRKLDNPHIVKVYDLFEENGTAYYVMDFINGGSLAHLLKKTGQPMSERGVLTILPQILDALDGAHKANILHLDLKPANIMIDQDGQVKLIDFGASKQLNVSGGATASTAVGFTQGYAPLEQMEGMSDKFGPWTDFYALGATLYTLLTNRRPPLPSDIDDDETEDKHCALPFTNNVSYKTKLLVVWLMSTKRKTRPQNHEQIRILLSKERTYTTSTKCQKEINEDTLWTTCLNITNNKEATPKEKLQDSHTRKKREALKKKNIIRVVIGVAIVGIISILYPSLSSMLLPFSTASKIVRDTVKVNEQTKLPNIANRLHCKIIDSSCKYSGPLTKDSIPNGEGEVWFDDGRYYKGYIANGKMVDKNAIFKFPNGDVYEGAFVNDHFSNGKYTIWQDKSYFIGSFNSQGETKKGTWYDKNGNTIEVIK